MAKCTLLGAEKDIMKHHAQSVLRDSVEKDTTDKKIRMVTPKSLHDSFCLELLRSKEKHRRLNTVTSLIKLPVCGNADDYLLKETQKGSENKSSQYPKNPLTEVKRW